MNTSNTAHTPRKYNANILQIPRKHLTNTTQRLHKNNMIQKKSLGNYKYGLKIIIVYFIARPKGTAGTKARDKNYKGAQGTNGDTVTTQPHGYVKGELRCINDENNCMN